MFESNLTEVPSNTWWIDSGFTIHVSNSMHYNPDFKPNESSIVVGNGVKVPVVATRTFRLFLDTDCYLDLFQILYVPSISRNLVSISKLDLEGYSFSFRNRRFSLFKILLLLVPVVYVMVCIN